MSPNIICSICFGDYHSTGEVASTTCGHLFHNHCIRKWIKRSPTCPQCRKHCTGVRQIFPQFADTADKSTENLKLKKELEMCITSSKKVQKNLLETKSIYANLQKKFDTLQLQHEQLKKKPNLLRNIENIKQQTAKEKTKFSGTQYELERFKSNEIHLGSLVKILEDQLNTLGIQLNIKTNLPHQRQKDELSDQLINIIINVSYMARACMEKQMQKNSEGQGWLSRAIFNYSCSFPNMMKSLLGNVIGRFHKKE